MPHHGGRERVRRTEEGEGGRAGEDTGEELTGPAASPHTQNAPRTPLALSRPGRSLVTGPPRAATTTRLRLSERCQFGHPCVLLPSDPFLPLSSETPVRCGCGHRVLTPADDSPCLRRSSWSLSASDIGSTTGARSGARIGFSRRACRADDARRTALARCEPRP